MYACINTTTEPCMHTCNIPKETEPGEEWREAKMQLDSLYFGHTGQRRGWVSSCRAAGGETRHLRTDRWKEGWTHHHCRAVGVALYEKLFKNSSEEDTPLST